MTLEATVTKVMWALGQAAELPESPRQLEQFHHLFYGTVNHDMLLQERAGGL